MEYFFSPVEQFDIFCLHYMFLFDKIDLSITDYVFYVLCLCFMFLFFSSLSVKKSVLIPNWWQMIVEFVYNLIWVQFVYQYLGKKGDVYFPFLFCLFFFILLGNFLGLVPYGMAPTGYLVLTFCLSFTVLIGCIILGFVKHKIEFFRLFVLEVNLLFLLFLIGMEIISYLMRGFSLAIRLSANITAGHTLLHVLAGFCIKIGIYSYIVTIFILLLLLFVLTLEFFVAVVQAYVFVVLVCLYINDSLVVGGH